MTKRPQDKHHEFVERLEDMVKRQYVMTMKEVEVRDTATGQTIGEIDLVGITENGWDLYEVKSSENYEKAVKQLERLRNYLGYCGVLNLYYYCGNSGNITKVR